MDQLRSLEKAMGSPVFLVGGMVRDKLLGKAPKDWDLTCPLVPEEMVQRLEAAGYRTIPTGLKHGTISVIFPEELVEITSHRSDGEYLDGRRPDGVRFGVSLEDDLARRDFTINAMALTLDGVLVDPFGGQEDLKRGLIRAVGEPLDRFSEDGLRPMRACRFLSQLNFEVAPSTARAIPLTLNVFDKVARERIHSEFDKLLKGKNPEKAIRLMAQTGLLCVWIPEVLEFNPSYLQMSQARSPLTKLATFFKGFPNAEEIMLRSKFPLDTISKVLRLIKHSDGVIVGVQAKTDYILRQIAASLEEKGLTIQDWLDLPNHFVMKASAERALMGQPPLQVKDLKLRGEDLQKLFPGKPLGPWVSKVLRHLQDLVHQDPAFNQPSILSEQAVLFMEQ